MVLVSYDIDQLRRRFWSFSSRPGAMAASIAPAQLLRGVTLALGAAVFWGIGPILIKAGLNQADLPFLGLFIAYSVATVLMGSSLVRSSARHRFASMNRRGLLWYVLAGLVSTLAMVLLFEVLSRGDVTLPVLLLQTSVLFVFLLTLLMNRHIDVLNRYVIAGGLLVMLGAAFVASQG